MTGRLRTPFFEQSGVQLSSRLPGTILVKRVGPRLRRARIVEVEAYLGPKDLASHSSRGRTARTEVMFGPAGRAYVYFIYGMHWMFNVVAGRLGHAHAVLIRAAEPLDGWHADLSGPGKLARGFGITREHNGIELTGDEFYFAADAGYTPRIERSKRIGVDYAGAWKHKALRFVDIRNPVAARLRS
ncbi:MAG TPA: DNA-3-methyladenine glycosylase [Planctomycetota bacterium]|jgi:DNA-3-methyladenine glycosylase|nr:DNA-3-methyladenine glycosylase [Planctomycetota bacterium]